MGTALQQKWISKLLGLDYEIHYKKGVENKAADALSRIDHGQCLAISTVVPSWMKEVQDSYEKSAELQHILQAKAMDTQAHPEFTVASGC